MITPSDLYHVFTAVVPLYTAMGLAYASVKWWNIFTAEQCSGINRFVALFAVPLLSFHFIAMNNPYTMSYSFIAADSFQKLLILFSLYIWCKSSPSSSLDSSITFFSISTLPNTLVMGIPLLRGMYGPLSSPLMVQIVVLQSILWYTLLLFLFEFRAANLLISHHFPHSASSIVSFTVHSDIVSLDGRDPLEAQADVGDDGKLHVIVRKSTSSRSEIFSRRSNAHNSILSLTPRLSNLTNAEIYSLQSSRNPTPRGSSFNHTDLYTMVNGRAATGASPRQSNFGNLGFEEDGGGVTAIGISPRNVYPPPPHTAGMLSPAVAGMYGWSGNASSPVCEGGIHVFRGGEATQQQQQQSQKEGGGEEEEEEFSFPKKVGEGEDEGGVKGEKKSGMKTTTMPATSVMTRLILIMVWRKLIRNPNTYSSIIGLTWSLLSFRFGIEMPAIVARSISILSDAGLGMAMFSLGLFMALQPRIIACGYRMAVFSMGVRFVVGPAVMAATSAAVGLRGILLHIAIVQAGLPQGIVPFVFAKEYNVHPDILSTGVIFGMLIALPITLLYYILLGL